MHGKIAPWPPFLTAMANPANIPVMLYEMAIIGTTISITILAVNYYMARITTLKTVEHIKSHLPQAKASPFNFYRKQANLASDNRGVRG